MSFVRSGAVTTAGREASFLKDQYYHTLEGLSYTDLESIKYQLYLDEVKRLGSIKKFKETYPGMAIPKPPVQIAGGPAPLPGSTPIPTIVPISRVPIHSSEEERKEEREDIMRMRNNQIGQEASDLPVPSPPIPLGGGGSRTETRGRPTPQGSVYVETLRQLMNKLLTDKRSNILQTTLNAKGFAQGFVGNKILQDALKKIFKDNGYDLSGKAGKESANRALEQILNSDVKSQQLLMNELIERLIQEEVFRGKFTVRDMGEDTPPEIQEPDPVKQEANRDELINKLETVMKPEEAERLYYRILDKAMNIRLDYYSKSGDYGFADDKTNDSIIKIVKEEINRIKSPYLDTKKIFKILRDNIPTLNIIPDSIVDRFPELRIPTPSSEKKERETEAKAREVIRDAGIELQPSGQFAGYGSFSITTSEALSRRLADDGYDSSDFEFDSDEFDDSDASQETIDIGLSDPDDGDDDYPYPRRETIQVRDRTGRVRTISGSYKMIVAILTALGAISTGTVLLKDDDIPPLEDSGDDELPSSLPSGEGSDDDKSLDTIKDEIRILKDKIEKAQNMGASQNVIDELKRKLNAKEKIYFIKYGDIAGQSQELSEARYAASNLLKNIEYYDDIIANANPQNIEFINRMKKQQDFYKSDYANIIKKISELTPNNPTSPTDDDDEGGDDPDSEITPPQNIPIEPTDTSEGVMIAQYIDPAEAKLFLSTDKESRNEQKRWEEFSRVQPGHSLGNARTNPLIAVNQEYYRKQFQNCDQTRKLVQPSIWKKPRGTIYNQPQLIDIYDGNARGKIHFEEDDWHTNRFMSSKLYNPFRTSVSNYNWNNANMNWHPEHNLSRYNFKPTTIPEIRTQPGYYSVDSRPSINNNPLIAPKQTGVKNEETRRNDNFQTKQPKKVYSNLSHFKQNVRIKSTRNR